MRHLLACLLCLPGLAFAQGLRDSDRVLDRTELLARLSGNLVTFFDDSTALYAADGLYAYRYRPQDPDWFGQYRAGEAGEVCVTFENGRDRCDTYVDAGGRLVLITTDGLRFPAKSVEPHQP